MFILSKTFPSSQKTLGIFALLRENKMFNTEKSQKENVILTCKLKGCSNKGFLQGLYYQGFTTYSCDSFHGTITSQ